MEPPQGPSLSLSVITRKGCQHTSGIVMNDLLTFGLGIGLVMSGNLVFFALWKSSVFASIGPERRKSEIPSGVHVKPDGIHS